MVLGSKLEIMAEFENITPVTLGRERSIILENF